MTDAGRIRLREPDAWRWLLTFGAVYGVLYALSVRMVTESSALAPLWPPAGALVAGLLLRDRTPIWRVLLVSFVAGRLAGTSLALPSLQTLAYAGAAWAEGLVAVGLLEHRRGPGLRFARVRDIVDFAFATVAAVTVNAMLVGLVESVGGRDIRQAMVTSWISGFLGILVVTPVMVAWARPEETTGRRSAPGAPQVGRTIEAGIMLTITALLTTVVFQRVELFDLISIPTYALAIPLIWAALRFDLRGVTSAVLLMTILSTMLVFGEGATVLGGTTPDARLLRLQLLIGFLALTGLVLNAAFVERRAAADAEARAAEALVASERRLQESQRMEAVGQLAGGIAHDFNNILSAMSLQVEELRAVVGLDSRARQTVRELSDGVQRASSFTQRLLLFGRRKAKEEVTLDLAEIGTGLASLLSRLMPPGIQLEFTSPSARYLVLGDRSMFEQVIMNLVINARDAMPAGGRITVAADRTTYAPDDVPGLTYGTTDPVDGATVVSYAVLRVSDTGAGIAPEHLPRLFEPFFTTKAEGKGTGLGLSTVLAIAQEHRGYIRVLSTSSAGTTFEFGVPLLVMEALPDDALLSSASAVRAGVSPGDAPVILLVEDHDDVRRMIQRILEREGFRVLSAPTGPEALQLWEHAGPVSLLLTDLDMPGGLRGTDLADELLRRQPGLRVVYTSGIDPTLGDHPERFVVGETFVPKPAPVAELLRVLTRQLAVEPCLDTAAYR